MVKINKTNKGNEMKNETRCSKPKFNMSYSELVTVHRLDINSEDYSKYKIAYCQWFNGLITDSKLRNIIKSI